MNKIIDWLCDHFDLRALAFLAIFLVYEAQVKSCIAHWETAGQTGVTEHGR